MLKDLNKHIPREFKGTLSGVKSYASSYLDIYTCRRNIAFNKKINSLERRNKLALLNNKLEQLTLILFTYALYLKFIRGDECIKESVKIFDSLKIKKVFIGTMELSKESKYYNIGEELALEMRKIIGNDFLDKMFRDRVNFYEIAEWFKKTQNVDI
jgi:hypothetical protein